MEQPLDIRSKRTPLSLLRKLGRLSGFMVVTRFIKTTGPIVISVYLFRDSVSIARSVTMISAMEGVSSIVFNSPLFYLPTVIGERVDKKERQYIGADFYASMFWVVESSLLQMAVLWSSPLWLPGLQQPASVTEQVKAFFLIYTPAVLPLSLQSSLDQLGQALQKPAEPAVAQSISWALTLVASYILIYPYKMGIKGAAIPLVARAYIHTASYLAYLYCYRRRRKPYKDIGLLSWHKEQCCSSLKKQLIMGMGFFTIFASTQGSEFAISLFVSRQNAVLSTQWAVLFQLQEMLSIFPISIGHATQVIVASYKQTEQKTSKQVMTQALLLSSIPPVLCMLPAIFFPSYTLAPFFALDNSANEGNLTHVPHGNITDVYQQAEEGLASTFALPITLLQALFSGFTMVFGQGLSGKSIVCGPALVGMFIGWLPVVAIYAIGPSAGLLLLTLLMMGSAALQASVVGGIWYYHTCKEQGPLVEKPYRTLVDAEELSEQPSINDLALEPTSHDRLITSSSKLGMKYG